MTLSEKTKLIETPDTLNGKDAVISGRIWHTVSRVVAASGAFKV